MIVIDFKSYFMLINETWTRTQINLELHLIVRLRIRREVDQSVAWLLYSRHAAVSKDNGRSVLKLQQHSDERQEL